MLLSQSLPVPCDWCQCIYCKINTHSPKLNVLYQIDHWSRGLLGDLPQGMLGDCPGVLGECLEICLRECWEICLRECWECWEICLRECWEICPGLLRECWEICLKETLGDLPLRIVFPCWSPIVFWCGSPIYNKPTSLILWHVESDLQRQRVVYANEGLWWLDLLSTLFSSYDCQLTEHARHKFTSHFTLGLPNLSPITDCSLHRDVGCFF